MTCRWEESTSQPMSSVSTASSLFFLDRFPLLAGRVPSEQDALERRLVAFSSESVARQLFPGRNPLGQHLDVLGKDREVIGVVREARSKPMRAYSCQQSMGRP